MVLLASFSCRISPRTSTVILRDRSPLATAMVTSEMLRTCAVRLLAIEFTLSVRSFHVPATPGTAASPPSFPAGPPCRLQVQGLLRAPCGVRRNGARDFRSRPQQVVDEGIHRPFHCAPGTRAPVARHAMTGPAVLADDLSGTLQLARQPLIGRHDIVEGIGYLARAPRLIAGDPKPGTP